MYYSILVYYSILNVYYSVLQYISILQCIKCITVYYNAIRCIEYCHPHLFLRWRALAMISFRRYWTGRWWTGGTSVRTRSPFSTLGGSSGRRDCCVVSSEHLTLSGFSSTVAPISPPPFSPFLCQRFCPPPSLPPFLSQTLSSHKNEPCTCNSFNHNICACNTICGYTV